MGGSEDELRVRRSSPGSASQRGATPWQADGAGMGVAQDPQSPDGNGALLPNAVCDDFDCLVACVDVVSKLDVVSKFFLFSTY